MEQKAIEKQFFKFVIPSMLTMLLNGLYTIVDGLFVGHAVGDIGLAGIGLVWPITALLLALGMGIGVGGSVLMSTYRGANDNQRANEARANTFFALLAVSVVVTDFLVIFSPTLVRAIGATGKIYDAAISYIRIIAIGGSMQIIASGLIPLIRNSHKTMQAMIIMGGGLIVNIVLDACFTMVIPMGLAGAALATVLAQAITVVCSIICLWKQKENKIERSQFKLNKKMIGRMMQIGISPFGLSLMPSLITIFNNWQCLAYGGDLAVSAYAVINYLIASVLLLLEGIGEGMQPLISYCNGSKNYKAMKKIRNKGFLAVVTFSGLFLLFSIPARTLLPQFFATSEETARIIDSALPIICVAFPMMGIGKLFSSYFYACEETLFSTLLVYLDPILFTPLCVFTLPHIWGIKGVWMALPGAQLLTMILLTILLIAHTMKFRSREAILYEQRN
ncbi:MATE family efflux transporter [Clostridium sp. CM028]|uniref:MATE family efflux transporter n=1 Tax=Clostridium sp. CM028 TaxID=2851575 RepID=UPI001C6E7791|nr:MATE family efflux transporter [Clostridium sp. CM028]MBW9148447.1 MATE family efflux transporter [Clostridium sp. CM028]WLC61020.1 MATE family efflux transporter [Clostridium sp. CM028]